MFHVKLSKIRYTIVFFVFLTSVSNTSGQTTIGLRGGLNNNILLVNAHTSSLNVSESSWIFNKSLYGRKVFNRWAMELRLSTNSHRSTFIDTLDCIFSGEGAYIRRIENRFSNYEAIFSLQYLLNPTAKHIRAFMGMHGGAIYMTRQIKNTPLDLETEPTTYSHSHQFDIKFGIDQYLEAKISNHLGVSSLFSLSIQPYTLFTPHERSSLSWSINLGGFYIF